MKKKITLVVVATFSLLVLLAGCGSAEQSLARDFGGTTTINLEANLKLEEITWKDDDLWYLTRPMREDEEPETHTFTEKGGLGTVFDGGTVIVVETKE
jgi:hypothetical protein